LLNLYYKERGMTKRKSRRTVIFLAVTFIFFCLAVDRVSAQQDTTTEVAIEYTTGYPGQFAEVRVMLKNPETSIAGFQFMITIENPELMNFHTDSIRVDTILIPIDTCTWEPDSLHGDTCFVDSLIPVPVRYCYIDTVGSLISEFQIVECHGDTGDTSLPDCKWIEVLGMGQLVGDSIYIPSDPNYRTLFRFGADLLCLPDSTNDRTESFYLFPGYNSFLSDRQGNTVPFKYNQGQLLSWWSLPGDANADSAVTAGDIVYLLAYLYRGGPRPCIPEAGDANADCFVTAGDVVYLMAYLYRDGPDPQPGCWHGGKGE
jgi:hypothetical protein